MIKIKYLCEYPRAISALAKIWCDSIGKKWAPDITASQIETRLHERLNKDALPLTYVAFDGEVPIGMCSLRANEEINSPLIPWLGSLCIQEDYRKRGIGKLLIQVVKEKSHIMGFTKLHLFTFEPILVDWYLGNGWKKIEDSTYEDKPITIMAIEL